MVGRSFADQLAKLKVVATNSLKAKAALARQAAAKPDRASSSPPSSKTKTKTKTKKSDEEVFLEEVAGTAPLPDRSGRVSASRRAERARARVSDDAEVLAQLADLCEGEGGFDISDTDEYIEGVAEGVDRRLLRRLRHGDYAVQGHVDLHGLTQAQAKERVVKYIAESRREGRRCVLLVHGRGLHSKDQIPILKLAVRSWLERGPIARAVLAFATARPCDGGAGAVYVLLRR
jgi:DNA-nicking Smr family endonuclease